MLHNTEKYHSGVKCVNIAPTVMERCTTVNMWLQAGRTMSMEKVIWFKKKEKEKENSISILFWRKKNVFIYFHSADSSHHGKICPHKMITRTARDQNRRANAGRACENEHTCTKEGTWHTRRAIALTPQTHSFRSLPYNPCVYGQEQHFQGINSLDGGW